MKTIADYQPHPMITTAIDTLINSPEYRVHLDATIVLAAQIAYDMCGQGLRMPPRAPQDWLAQAIEERRAALAK